jgi:two-component system NtrC family sensor kinase
MMIASLALPVALFVVICLISHHAAWDEADHDITRSLDIVHEHALKVFETIDRSLAEANEVIRGLSDDDIRAREQELHLRLRQIVESMPQMKSVWVFDAQGRAVVNSLIYPAPDISFADRDYFQAHIASDVGTFISAVLTPRTPYQGASFFGVSRRRSSADGAFAGVIQASLLPEYSSGSTPASAAMPAATSRCAAPTARHWRGFRLSPATRAWDMRPCRP